MISARAFTAISPSGTIMPSLTRLRRRGVHLAVCQLLSGTRSATPVKWNDARKNGWKVVPVTMTATATPGARL